MAYKTTLSTQAQDSLRAAIEEKYAPVATTTNAYDSLANILNWYTVPNPTWNEHTTTT